MARPWDYRFCTEPGVDESTRRFRRAMTIDPAHLSRDECAAALTERGDPDDSVRELTHAVSHERPRRRLYRLCC